MSIHKAASTIGAIQVLSTIQHVICFLNYLTYTFQPFSRASIEEELEKLIFGLPGTRS